MSVFGLVAGRGPTVVGSGPSEFVLDEVIDEGEYLDIGELWQRSKLDDVYPSSFHSLGAQGAKHFFMPAYSTWVAVYYNKGIFEQYGLTPPETWDEFLALCDALLANDVTPIVLGWGDYVEGAFWWFDYLDLRLNGPEFHAKVVQGQEPYTTQAIQQVFETWQTLFDKGYFEEDGNYLRMAKSLNVVVEGKAAMVLFESLRASDFPPKLREELGLFRFPVMDPSIPVGEVGMTFGYAISSETLCPMEAMEFLGYLASGEVQSVIAQQYGQTIGIAPIHREVDAKLANPEVKQGLMLLQEADHVGQPYASHWGLGRIPENWLPTHYAFAAFLEGKASIEETLNALEEVRQAELEE